MKMLLTTFSVALMCMYKCSTGSMSMPEILVLTRVLQPGRD